MAEKLFAQIEMASAIIERMNHGSTPVPQDADYITVRKDELVALIVFYVSHCKGKIE